MQMLTKGEKPGVARSCKRGESFAEGRGPGSLLLKQLLENNKRRGEGKKGG